MNPYHSFVESVVSGVEDARAIKMSGKRELKEADDKVLLFSPHPDDECIVGLLPLRLQEELDCQIINVPMTFGSREDRREGRWEELQAACSCLGWSNYRAREDFENLTVSDVVKTLEKFSPKGIVFPHAEDWNSRHMEVHHLLIDALSQMEKDFSCVVVQSEFWGAMDDPNTLVEGSTQQVADLVAATSLHVGEVERNPYHLRLPAWMQDNVRRGAELVGGQGERAPAFHFGTLYRISEWRDGEVINIFEKGQVLSCEKGQLERMKRWK